MTSWKWRDLNHQPFGELIYLFIHSCVFVTVIVLLRNLIMWTWQNSVYLCQIQDFML